MGVCGLGVWLYGSMWIGGMAVWEYVDGGMAVWEYVDGGMAVWEYVDGGMAVWEYVDWGYGRMWIGLGLNPG